VDLARQHAGERLVHQAMALEAAAPGEVLRKCPAPLRAPAWPACRALSS
jgi:hypothetical protein